MLETTTLKIFVNDKFYRDLLVRATQKDGKLSYDPNDAVKQVMADREAGLLNLFIKPDGIMKERVEQI